MLDWVHHESVTKAGEPTKEQPCVKCPERKYYARFDMHISGEDCPYVCEEYEEWKAEQKEDSKVNESADSL